MTPWVTVAVLCVGTVAIKAAGPVAVGGRRPSEGFTRVVAMVAPALLAALVVYETVHSGTQSLKVDARLVGVAAAAIAIRLRAPLTVIALAAAATTALARAIA
jgi:branched chain amino acid efflux pump